MNLPSKTIQRLQTGAVFHDIGKIGIPDSILQKPGSLTPEERAVIQRHPVIGVDILKNIDSYQDILELVRRHHERYDGGGYPDGTCGEEFSLVWLSMTASGCRSIHTVSCSMMKMVSLSCEKAEKEHTYCNSESCRDCFKTIYQSFGFYSR